MTTARNTDQDGEGVFADSELAPSVLIEVFRKMGLPFDASKPDDLEAAILKMDEILQTDPESTKRIVQFFEESQNANLASSPAGTNEHFEVATVLGEPVSDFLFDDWPSGVIPNDRPMPRASDAIPDARVSPRTLRKAHVDWLENVRKALMESLNKPRSERWVSLNVNQHDTHVYDTKVLHRFFDNAVEALPKQSLSDRVFDALIWSRFKEPEPVQTIVWNTFPNAGLLELTKGEKNWLVVYAIDNNNVHVRVGNDDRFLHASVEEAAKFSSKMTAAFGGHPDMARAVLTSMQRAIEGPDFIH